MTRVLEPLADAKLILGRAQELGDLESGECGVSVVFPHSVIQCRIEGIES